MNFLRTPIMLVVLMIREENIREARDKEVGTVIVSLTQSESLDTESEKMKEQENVSAQEIQTAVGDEFPDGGRQAWLAVLGSWVSLEVQISRSDAFYNWIRDIWAGYENFLVSLRFTNGPTLKPDLSMPSGCIRTITHTTTSLNRVQAILGMLLYAGLIHASIWKYLSL